MEKLVSFSLIHRKKWTRTVTDNECMRLKSRMEARFRHFPLIAVTGYRSHAARRVELIGYFVHFGHPVLFCEFHC